MQVSNVRWVTISDESGERQAVAAEVQVEGAELDALLAADLAIPTQPSAGDSRAVARPLAEAVQGLPS